MTPDTFRELVRDTYAKPRYWPESKALVVKVYDVTAPDEHPNEVKFSFAEIDDARRLAEEQCYKRVLVKIGCPAPRAEIMAGLWSKQPNRAPLITALMTYARAMGAVKDEVAQ